MLVSIIITRQKKNQSCSKTTIENKKKKFFFRIGLEGVETLAESFAYSISLKYINLSKCDLNDAGGVVVVEAMQINDICKILDLSYNKLSSQTAAQLEVLLREKHTLEHLYLNWNNFYPEKGN